MTFAAQPATAPLRGTVRVPGDKSISHRAVLFAAMADGDSRLTGVLDSEDVRSSIEAVRALGAVVEMAGEAPDGLALDVTGWGASGPIEPPDAIDCGNSGTTARLLMGVLAGWGVLATLTGDASLSARPMRRVIEPLASMGAQIESTGAGTLPVTVHGGALHAARVELSVASAQIKSAILLAGLHAAGRTIVVEPTPCRDHTERMLPLFGVGVGRDQADGACWVDGPSHPVAADLAVPADPSSAAFLAGAAAIVPGSLITLTDVCLNPTRTGFLRVLERMGAGVRADALRASGAEPVGTITCRFSPGLHHTCIAASEIPSLVDEVPLLAVVATQADGTTRFEGVGELRVKESDRLAALHEGLTLLGATVRSGQDWLEVDGPASLRGCTLDSLGDHRLAMAWAVAALACDSPVHIHRWESVAVSYPSFARDLALLQTPGGGEAS